MQFKGKLMNQTWESGKKTIGPNLVPKSFFGGFYLYQILNIVASYHCMQFQGKLMKQTWENDWKPSFGSDFGPNFVPKCFCKFYLYYMLWIVVSYHPMQFHGKLMNQTWENGKKLVSRPILAHLAQIRATNFLFRNVAPSVTRYHGQLSSCKN